MISVTREAVDQIIEYAKKIGVSDAKFIKPADVIVRDWVRLKCRFGCPDFGKYRTCPPYSPTPDEFRKILSEYNYAILFKIERETGSAEDFKNYLKSVPHIIIKVEREAFLKGYYSAFGLAAGSCPYCEKCNIEKCAHPDLARPAMEGCGIDVFGTVRNAGFDVKVVKDENDKPSFFALLLLA